MKDEIEYLPVTIDKGHIITIGERLYEQSIELVRELVNNAYDADATRVEVTVAPNEITVVDDGEGMDFDGLKQYFNVGSDMKLQNPISPKFGRNRIGQFGIGKFASLAAASSFEYLEAGSKKGRWNNCPANRTEKTLQARTCNGKNSRGCPYSSKEFQRIC